jgi:hypothetical protein
MLSVKLVFYGDCLKGKRLVHYLVGRLIVYPPIAQLVEQIPLKDKVVGSIPTGRTRKL